MLLHSVEEKYLSVLIICCFIYFYGIFYEFRY